MFYVVNVTCIRQLAFM